MVSGSVCIYIERLGVNYRFQKTVAKIEKVGKVFVNQGKEKIVQASYESQK